MCIYSKGFPCVGIFLVISTLTENIYILSYFLQARKYLYFILTLFILDDDIQKKICYSGRELKNLIRYYTLLHIVRRSSIIILLFKVLSHLRSFFYYKFNFMLAHIGNNKTCGTGARQRIRKNCWSIRRSVAIMCTRPPQRKYPWPWRFTYRISAYRHSVSLWREPSRPGFRAPLKLLFWGPLASEKLAYYRYTHKRKQYRI